MLILAAIFPIILLAIIFYRLDKIEKEPKKELVKALFSGLGAVILTLVFSFMLNIHKIDSESLSSSGIILYTFFGIAIIEEASKWIISYFLLKKNKHLDSLYDYMLYVIYVGLGFALIENILYSLSGGMFVAIFRAILTVPSHAFYAIFMGYYLEKAKEDSKHKKKYMLLSLVIPFVLHGIFDALLLLGEVYAILLFFVFIIFLYVKSISLVKKIQREDSKKISDSNINIG